MFAHICSSFTELIKPCSFFVMQYQFIFALINCYLFIIASDRAESDFPVSKKQHEDPDTTGNILILCSMYLVINVISKVLYHIIIYTYIYKRQH